MLQSNCTCLEIHSTFLLPRFSVEEPAGKSVLLPQQACRKQLLEKNNPGQIRKKTRKEVGHTFLSASCSTWQSSVWWSQRPCLASLVFYIVVNLEVTGQSFPSSMYMLLLLLPLNHQNNPQQTSKKKPQQIIQLEFFHWYESFPVIKLQTKCCSQALSNDCFMTVL